MTQGLCKVLQHKTNFEMGGCSSGELTEVSIGCTSTLVLFWNLLKQASFVSKEKTCITDANLRVLFSPISSPTHQRYRASVLNFQTYLPHCTCCTDSYFIMFGSLVWASPQTTPERALCGGNGRELEKVLLECGGRGWVHIRRVKQCYVDVRVLTQ